MSSRPWSLVMCGVTAALGIFPWTRGISAQLLGAVLTTLKAIGLAFAYYVPNVISIIVIIFVTRYIIKLIALVFTGMERGAISFKEFRREWTRPTFKIVRFLVIVFAAIAIFPYIPGSQSDAFRGVSVFLGVLLSFGSAGAISNIIAGVILTYMHPFREGDRVKIADTTGDIIERTLLVTRIRTIKNVDISIPNSIVLGSHLINYSSVAKEPGLILHTSVTIGYDAPWKTVHGLLIASARATTQTLLTPTPFVLQTSLDDYYVTYEINVYTDQANMMATIYAELHQNIQDKFNEAGVEIMSPHYTQIRDGNQTTIPDPYLPKTYQTPSFSGLAARYYLFAGSKDAGSRPKASPGHDISVEEFSSNAGCLDPTVSKPRKAATVAILIVMGLVRSWNLSHYVQEPGNSYRAKKMVSVLGYFIGLLSIAMIFSDSLGKMAVVFGVAGAGIAFALQEIIIASLAGWVAISFGNFYKTGDRVQLGGIKGTSSISACCERP